MSGGFNVRLADSHWSAGALHGDGLRDCFLRAMRTSKDAIFSFSWGGVQRMRRRRPGTLRWFKGTAPHGGIKRRSAAWARCSALLLLLL